MDERSRLDEGSGLVGRREDDVRKKRLDAKIGRRERLWDGRDARGSGGAFVNLPTAT